MWTWLSTLFRLKNVIWAQKIKKGKCLIKFYKRLIHKQPNYYYMKKKKSTKCFTQENDLSMQINPYDPLITNRVKVAVLSESLIMMLWIKWNIKQSQTRFSKSRQKLFHINDQRANFKRKENHICNKPRVLKQKL